MAATSVTAFISLAYTSASERATRASVQVGEAAEKFETLIDLVAGERLQTLGPELLHGEGTHHPSVEHCVLQHQWRNFTLRGHVSHESAGEGISGASRIVNFFDGQRRSSERMMRA